jgi:arabinan endo-1,5-alpha-L-arabinosidase
MKRISTRIFVCILFLFSLPFAGKANFGNTAISDPSSIVKYNGVYHAFGTGAQITHLTSTDLVNWTAAPTVFAAGTWPSWISSYVPTFAGNFWAPEIINISGTWKAGCHWIGHQYQSYDVD